MAGGAKFRRKQAEAKRQAARLLRKKPTTVYAIVVHIDGESSVHCIAKDRKTAMAEIDEIGELVGGLERVEPERWESGQTDFYVTLQLREVVK